MSLQKLHIILRFSIIIIIIFITTTIIPCYNCFEIHPTINDYLEEASTFDSSHQPYPSYYTSIENYFIKQTNYLPNLKIIDKAGTLSTSVKKVDVDHFGAKADGSDDTKAFQRAWKEACSSEEGSVVVVPADKTYHIKPVRFSGPCKSNLTLEIYGSIEAWEDRDAYEKDLRHWIVFDGVENLLVEGGGTIDGNGNIWWQNSCKVNKDLPCKHAPTALTFYKCKNLVVKNLKIQNAQQMHLSFQGSNNVQVSNLIINSPENSPNTDGIHVTETQNVCIANSVISTGDDCISIVSGSQYVVATQITCGPGHGISIGSLGSKNSRAYVSGVTIDGAKISGTTNGLRIKTWQGGSGIASNIKFQNINMDNVTNPIIIDQCYCDQDRPCKEQKSAVQVKNVVYKNIKGTSASDVAIKFECSKSYPCQGILLQDVVLQSKGNQTAKASCLNVNFVEMGVVCPHCSSN